MGDTSNIVIGGATALITADLGYIKNGVVITPTFEVYKVDGIEGLPVAVKTRRTKTEYACAFTLVEPTLANIKIAHDVTSAVDTGAGPPAPETLDIDAPASTTERVLVVTGIVPGGNEYVRTVTFDRAIIESPGEMKFTDFEETQLPVTFVCLYDSTNSRVGEYSDATA